MKDFLLTVEYNKQLTKSVFELKLVASEPLPCIRAGQFLNIETPAKNAILRRPFCIHKWGDDYVVIVVEKKGSGTIELAKVTKGQTLKAILPLGNGFTLDEEHKKVVILGGSIGCAPLLGIMSSYPNKEYHTFLGFKDKAHVLFESDFSAHSKTTVCTYDGSYGQKGYPVPTFEAEIEDIKPDVILVCGSKSLIRGARELCDKYNIPSLVSTEERMACGIGACLGCTCKVKDESGTPRNKRVCMDGPVFNIKDMVL